MTEADENLVADLRQPDEPGVRSHAGRRDAGPRRFDLVAPPGVADLAPAELHRVLVGGHDCVDETRDPRRVAGRAGQRVRDHAVERAILPARALDRSPVAPVAELVPTLRD